MKNFPLPRLEIDEEARKKLLPFCRLSPGGIWIDKHRGHRIGCIDIESKADLERLMEGRQATLAIHDPPYNVAAFPIRDIGKYISWCRIWISSSFTYLKPDSSLYVWLGADQNNGFQPLPDFMVMMREHSFKSRSFITMRNQRGYGTQKNWMSIRQELLYYTKGDPIFNVEAEYTDIPKILRGYYKDVGGKKTENMERSKSDNIRAGNVWVDVQQVFYRMRENVNGCYAQKPLKAIERIIRASSAPGDLVIDWFAHSGATLIGSEIHDRVCFAADIDPIFCEITIRRLERYREYRELGWQNSNPFEIELGLELEAGKAHSDTIGGLTQRDLWG
ncbi:MAG: DNA-methyltransferase [Methylococcales bacterium]